MRIVAPACVLAIPKPLVQPAWSEPAQAPACDRAAFLIFVLDVGLTPEVPGAISARGVSEFEFNRNLAKQIEQKLIDTGFTRTALIVTIFPSRPGLLSASRRPKLPADLFVSIHHHLWCRRYSGTVGIPRKANALPADRFKGHSRIFVSYDNPWGRGSRQFANLLGSESSCLATLQYTPHYTEALMPGYCRELIDADAGVYRYDKLVVLRATRMLGRCCSRPGSIVNRDEDPMESAESQEAAISEGAAAAIDKFCAARRPPEPALIARRPAAPVAAGAHFRGPRSATSHRDRLGWP